MRRLGGPLLVIGAGTLVVGFLWLNLGLTVPWPEPNEPGCGGRPEGPGAVVAVEPDTGDERWATTVGTARGFAPAGGVAVVNTEDLIRGLATDTGDIVWCVPIDQLATADTSSTGTIGSTDKGVDPTSPSTTVDLERPVQVVAAGSTVALFVGPDVIALDPASGEVRWATPVPEEEVRLTGLPGGDRYLITSGLAGNEPLAELDAGTGERRPVRTTTIPTPSLSTVGGYGLLPPPASVDGLTLHAEHPWPGDDRDRGYVEGRQELRISVSRSATGGELSENGDRVSERPGAPLWSNVVPGVVAAMVPSSDGPVVSVIDQTGFTGLFDRLDAPTVASGQPLTSELSNPASGDTAPPIIDLPDNFPPPGDGSLDTRVTGYDAETGAPRWQVAVPGTPLALFPIDRHTLMVANGTELHAIDPGTGTLSWRRDVGNPGTSRKYSQLGTFRAMAPIVTSKGETLALGFVIAEQPYRD